MQYVFGTWDAPITDDAEPIDVPTDLRCWHCDEPFVDGDDGGIALTGLAEHKECGYRSVMGGIGHHIDHARYCRSDLGPDAGLTRRQSALLVWRLLVDHEPVTEADVAALMADTLTRCSECGRKLNPDPSHPGRNGHLRTCSRTGQAADA